MHTPESQLVLPVPQYSSSQPGRSGWPSPAPHLPSSTPLSLPPAKGRAISLPMDLDAHISSLLSSGASCVAAAQRNASNYKATTRSFPRVTPTANQWDYKNIIEKLQVGAGLPGVGHESCFGSAVPGKHPFPRCPRSPGKRPCKARPCAGGRGASFRGKPGQPRPPLVGLALVRRVGTPLSPDSTFLFRRHPPTHC